MLCTYPLEMFGLTSRRTPPGFTLIELLLAIAIIAIIASISIVAINPQKQIKDARNAKRRSDVNTILNAMYQYMIDNGGQPPSPLTSEAREICKITDPICNNGVSLRALSGTYVVSIPKDPIADPEAEPTGTGTDYFIYQDSFGRITITAPNAELGISISR